MNEHAERVRDLVRRRLDELGLEMKAVSRLLGRNPAYMHQYLHKRSPVYINEHDRPALAQILKISEDELRPKERPAPTTRPSRPLFPGVRKPITDQALIEGLIARMLHINKVLKLNWPPERMARAITLGYEAGIEKDEPNPEEIIDKLVAAIAHN